MKLSYLLLLWALIRICSFNQFAMAGNDDECMNDQQCEEGEVCATIKGERPGSCALSIDVKPYKSHSEKGCMKDRECDEGEVCATVRGEFPGSCARKGNKLF